MVSDNIKKTAILEGALQHLRVRFINFISDNCSDK